MKEHNLKLAQTDIDEALNTIEDLEKNIKNKSLSEEVIKENFLKLTSKMNHIENILIEEGIL